MASLSLCMIVRDESEVLARCLASVAGAVDEMVVVDTGSVDDTPAIARSFGARVHTFDWIDDFAAARNRSFDLATCSHVLWLDADDVLLPEDREKLLALKPRLEKDVYWLPYDYEQDVFGSSVLRFHRERIVRNTPEIRWVSPIHEYLSLRADMSSEDVDITVSHRRTPNGRERDRGRGIAILERLLALPERAGEAHLHFDLGRDYEYAGLWEEASRSYERFLELAGPPSVGDACAFEHIARHYLLRSFMEPSRAAGHRRRARLAAEEAGRLDPRRAEPCVLLGRIAEAEADPEAAVLWYGRALRPMPTKGFLAPADYTVVPAERLSALWRSLGDPLKANTYNEAALAWRPRDPILLLIRRQLRAHVGAALATPSPVRLSFGKRLRGYRFCSDEPAAGAEAVLPLHSIPLEDGAVAAIACARPPARGDLPRTLREWHRVLQPGGEAVLRHPAEGDAPDAPDVALMLAATQAGFVLDYVGRLGGDLAARLVKPVRPESAAFVTGPQGPPASEELLRRIDPVVRWLRARGYRAGTIETAGQMGVGVEVTVFASLDSAMQREAMRRARAQGSFVVLAAGEEPLALSSPLAALADAVVQPGETLERWREILFDRLPDQAGTALRIEPEARRAPRGRSEKQEGPLLVAFCMDWLFNPWNDWNGDMPDRRGIGGTETAVVCLAEALARLGHRVLVFGSSESVVRGVEYLNVCRLAEVAAARPFDAFIAVGYTAILDLPIPAARRYFWSHVPTAADADTEDGDRLRRHCGRLDAVVSVSPWHRESLARFHGVPGEKIVVMRNGVNPERFAARVPRQRNRFIYSSSAERGLETLLELFPRIRRRLPDAELHVFYGFQVWDHWLAGCRDPVQHARRASVLAALDQPGVFYHGRVGQRQLAEEMQRSEIWFYPTHITEAYCISALEAQMAGAVCVCSDLAALRTTVGDRGILIPGDVYTEEYRRRALDEVFGILEDRERRRKLTARARRWARRQTWSRVAEEWVSLFRSSS